MLKTIATEHSENKVIMQSGLFENEIRPGVLHSVFSVQRLVNQRPLEEGRIPKVQTMCNYHVSILSLLYGNFCKLLCLLTTGLEQSRSNLVLEIHNRFIFGMLY